MKSRFILPALLMAAFTATTASAQVQEGAFTASLFTGGYTFDDDQDIETDFAHGVRLGYNFSRHWGIETQFTHVRIRPSNDVSRTGDLYNVNGDLLYHFMPTNTLVPFVVLGGGWSRTTNIDGADGTLDYGAGVKYFVTDSVALRGDVRNILSFHSDKYGGGDYWSNYEYTAGVTFQFGGSPAATPAAVVEKPVAVVKEQRPEPAPPLQTAAPAPVPAPVAVPAAMIAPAAAPKAEPVTAPQLPPAVVTAVQEEDAPKDCSRCEVNSVSEVVVKPQGVEIISDLGIRNYRVFKLSSPTRLVIDICCATNGFKGKTLKFDVKRNGISTVRVGTHPDRQRIVLESPLARFPNYRMEKTETGLNLQLLK